MVFQTSFRWDNGLIADQDAVMLEEMLLSSDVKSGFLLIVNSPGGFASAAERLVNMCQKYSKDGFDVLVPHMAKSAATIVCFGSKKIWMGRTSELGPVDPQVYIKQDTMVSVYNLIKSYEDLLKKASKAERVEAYLHQLRFYDPRELQQFRQEMKLSEVRAIQCLQNGMMKGQSYNRIRNRIRMFWDPAKTLEHGRPIYRDQAKKCGINIGRIEEEKGEQAWEAIWELQHRYDYVLNMHYGKVIESAETSWTAPGHFHPRPKIERREDSK